MYKVETSCDAYMVASGLPVRNGDRHALEIATMALEVIEEVRDFKANNENVQIKIGIHSGLSQIEHNF